MRYLNATEFAHVIPDDDYCDLVQTAYRHFGTERQVSSHPPIAVIHTGQVASSIMSMKGAALASQGVYGVFFGVRDAHYYFAVCDSTTGNMLGMVEQSASICKRTGASSVVAASLLARPDAKVAAVVGSGKIATEVVRQLPRRFALDSIHVASRTLQSARGLVDRLQPEIACTLQAHGTVGEAVAEADIVVTITTASAPFIREGMLKPGSFLCSLGGVHEVEFGVLKEIDRLVVDDIGYALWRGDFASWIARGDISQTELQKRINADIGQVALGQAPGRRAGERSMAVIQGLALCDLVIAKEALERAQRAGIGTQISSAMQMRKP